MKKTSVPNQISDINVAARVASGTLKVLAFLSDITVYRFAVEREYLKPYKKLEKRPHCLKQTTTLLLFFVSFSKEFNNHRKKSNRVVVSRKPLQRLLSYLN